MYAFADFSQVENIVFGADSQLIEIQDGAFANCSQLQSITLPATLETIVSTALINCSNLSTITIDNNSTYESKDGVLYTKNLKKLLIYPAGRNAQTYTIEDNCTTIEAYAFLNNNHILNLNLNNVEIIDYYGIYSCANLSTISGANLDYIELGVFLNTPFLTNNSNEMVILGNVLIRYQGDDTEIVISNVTSIAPLCFAGNETLTEVTFDNDVTNIGRYAFYACNNLENVYFNNLNNVVYIGTATFDKNSDDQKIYVPACLLSDYLDNDVWDQYDLSVHQTTINYELFGGTIPDTYNTAIGYGDFFDLPIPLKTGYLFDGWYNSNINGVVCGDGYLNGEQWQSYDETVNLYAKWEPETYTITLNPNGGNVVPATVNYTIEDNVVLPTPTLAGYHFDGWYLSSNYATENYIGDTLPVGTTGNLQLYAKWTAETYTITYDLNANGPGAILTSPTTTKNITYGQPYSLDIPTREGHIFNGWKDVNGVFYSNENGASTFSQWNYAGNITLKADWVRIEYYIKITDEGRVYWVTEESDFDTYQSPIEYGTELLSPSLLAEAFNPNDVSLKVGHKFKYFTASSTSDTPISSWSDLVPNNISDGAIVNIYTYYEKEINFSIDFIGVATQPGTNPFVTEYDNEITYVTPSDLVGHKFKYWKVATVPENLRYEGTTLAPGTPFQYARMPDLSEGIEEDGTHIYLEPHFEANSYLIVLSSKYGTLPYTSKEIVYGTTTTLPVLTETGRTFLGWYTSSNGGTQITTDNGIMTDPWVTTYTVILHAQWNANLYLISYVSEGALIDQTTFTIDSLPQTLLDKSRSGYRFMGWYTDTSYENRIYQISEIGNITVYAKWEQLYTVSFITTNGTSCNSITGIEGESIILPSSTRGGYHGTWSFWGYLTNDATISNFGYSYTIGNADTTLSVVWKEKTLNECYNYNTMAYEIWTFNQLNSIRNYYSTSEIYGTYKLMADIILSGYWEPLPSFYGNFDGNNHKIKNLKFSSNNIFTSNLTYIGFFQKNYGTIKNIQFTNVQVNLTQNNTVSFGVVSGLCSNDAQIINCDVSSDTIMTIQTGSFELSAGVITGYNQGGHIEQCGASFYILKTNNAGYCNVGGIVGVNATGNVVRSYSEGRIEAFSSGNGVNLDVGGLIGRCSYSSTYGSPGYVGNCYSTCYVYAETNGTSSYVFVGGLVGVLKESWVNYSFATGEVYGKNNTGNVVAGGFAGVIENCTGQGCVYNCFTFGDVYARGNYSGAEKRYSFFGRLCGDEANNSFLNIYYNINSKFKDGLTGTEVTWNTSWYIGKTEAQLKTISFQVEELDLNSNYWNFVEGQFPTLK